MTHAQELNQIMANFDDLSERELGLVTKAIMETLTVIPRDSMEVNGVIGRVTNQVGLLVADSWRKRGRVESKSAYEPLSVYDEHGNCLGEVEI